MSSRTSTHKSAAFDEIYARVPREQVARLKKFRRTHPYKQLSISDKKADTNGDTKWEYISCGQGEQTLLLLPGALSIGESLFPFIEALKTNIASSRLPMRSRSRCLGCAVESLRFWKQRV